MFDVSYNVRFQTLKHSTISGEVEDLYVWVFGDVSVYGMYVFLVAHMEISVSKLTGSPRICLFPTSTETFFVFNSFRFEVDPAGSQGFRVCQGFRCPLLGGRPLPFFFVVFRNVSSLSLINDIGRELG